MSSLLKTKKLHFYILFICNFMAKKFYVTTAIDYVNAEPHIGHAYQKIIADVLARWHKNKDEEVFFLTGTDEHGQKIANSAGKNGKTPKEFVNLISPKFENAWKELEINFDRFIRTTDKDHEESVKKFVELMQKKGDIYKGEYKGLYCEDCEAYYTEKDLVDGKCPYHPNKEIKELSEETYFFKLSKYQKKLLRLYEENENFILPKFRRKEIINRVKEGLKDLSITRLKESMSWGISFPLNEKHVIYVWYEALLNYITGIGWPDGKNFKKFWPADVEILGIDNGWFHCVIWPAMLFSVGIKPPKTILINGFLTFNERKISKSLGNAISPVELVKKYSADAIRYYVCRNFVFGQDGDFSEKALIDRYNNELANKLGNLVSRVSGLIEKFGVEKTANKLIKKLDEKKISKLMENFEIDKALSEIFAFIDRCNEYVQEKKPWETKDKKILFELKESILKISELLEPFIPESSEKIKKQFGAKKIVKGEPLFVKIETADEENKEKVNKSEHIEGIMNANEVEFRDWEKLDLRVAEIKKVEDIDGADKLYKLTLDVGSLGERTICAGLKPFYKKEKLKNKKIIYFSNLKPRTMKGIESQGMLLAASSENHEKVVLISPDADIDVGSRIG